MNINRLTRFGRVANIFLKNANNRNYSESTKLHHLKRKDGQSIAYHVLTAGPQDVTRPGRQTVETPGVVFCPGFQSNMQGVKALALENYCKKKGLAFVRFDYRGCGESTGNIREVTFSDWKNDLLAVLDNLTAGPQILVGSSMGAWLMLLVAMERKHRIHSLVGLASAPDFSQRAFTRFNNQALSDLKTQGETIIKTDWGNYVITQKFLDDVNQHNILHQTQLPLTCPVRLIHGMKDDFVPYQLSLQLAEKLNSSDVMVLFRKNGDHRLSQHEDIVLMFQELDHLIEEAWDAKKLAIESWASFSVYSHPDQMKKQS